MSLNHYAILQIHKDQLTETTTIVSEYFLSSHFASDYRQKKRKKERKTYFVSTIVAALIGGSMNLTPA